MTPKVWPFLRYGMNERYGHDASYTCKCVGEVVTFLYSKHVMDEQDSAQAMTVHMIR